MGERALIRFVVFNSDLTPTGKAFDSLQEAIEEAEIGQYVVQVYEVK